jgi:hypothetical protein
VLVDVVREIPERSDSKPPKKDKVKGANLSISDNWVQLSGPKFAFIADGTVVNMSTAYKGADYDYSLRVDVITSGERTFGFLRRERWTVKVLPHPEEKTE